MHFFSHQPDTQTNAVHPPWYCLFQIEHTVKHPDDIIKPSMDLDTDDDGKTVIATFELPGVKKEDVNIDVYRGVLWVSGEKKLSKQRGKNAHSIHERQFGKFSRTLHLPEGVKRDEIKASKEDGLLVLTFPNHEHGANVDKVTVS